MRLRLCLPNAADPHPAKGSETWKQAGAYWPALMYNAARGGWRGLDGHNTKPECLRQPLALQRFLYLRPRHHARLVDCEIF